MMQMFSQYGRLLFALPLLLTVLLPVSGCSQNTETAAVKKIEDNYEFVSVGYAAMAAQKGDSEDIKMLNAIKASKLDAYKELAEQVYGVMLTSENSVQKHQLQRDTLNSKVSGLVRGARVLRTYHEGDLYITELGLNMKTLPFLKHAEFADNDDVIKVQPQVYY